METKDIISQLEAAYRDAGPINHARCVTQALESMKQYAEKKLMYVDVYLSNDAVTGISHPFRSLSSMITESESHQQGYSFRFIQPANLLPAKLGDAMAGVCVVVLDGTLLQDQTMMDALQRNSVQYSLMMVLNYTGNERSARSVKFDFYGKWIEVSEPGTEQSLVELLNQYISPQLKKLLIERGLLNGVKPAIQISRELFQKETQLLTFQKNLNGHLNNDIRRREYDGNINETNSNIRNLIQVWVSEQERAIKIKYEELNKPNTGRYASIINDWSEDLKELKKEELADKSEKWVTSINQDFLDGYLRRINSVVASDLSNDYNLVLGSVDSLTGKLNAILKQKGIDVQLNGKANPDLPTIPNPEKSIKSYMHFNRHYGGEMVKKGAAEYFIALREYTGLIMVVAGLLAPLNMIATISQNEVMKSLSNIIRVSTGGITLVMIIYGYFDLRKRIPRRRVEEFDRELKRAKENLQQEGKKMMSDISKDWQNQISLWLRDTANALQLHYEGELKQFSGKKAEELNAKKNTIQKNSQAIDSISRRLSSAEKIVDNCQRNYRDQLSDLEKSIKTAAE